MEDFNLPLASVNVKYETIRRERKFMVSKPDLYCRIYRGYGNKMTRQSVNIFVVISMMVSSCFDDFETDCHPDAVGCDYDGDGVDNEDDHFPEDPDIFDDCFQLECGLSPNLGYDCGPCSDPTLDCVNNMCISFLDWVTIEGGTYEMGSLDGDFDERPVHDVTVSTFQMMKTEVTRLLYFECVSADFCPGQSTNWDDQENWNLPCTGITWDWAVSFCNWTGARLPTEAEWEYAARSGGQNITFPWGNAPATPDYAVMSASDGFGSSNVCSIEMGNTAQGLCDMAGNVWEWVQDNYSTGYDGAPTDGSAWESSGAPYRIFRGGSYNSTTAALRAANRNGGAPSITGSDIGFRCAR